MLIYTDKGWQPLGLTMLQPTPAVAPSVLADARAFVATRNDWIENHHNAMLDRAHRSGRQLDRTATPLITLEAYLASIGGNRS